MKQWHIQHPQDRMDAEIELRRLKYPYDIAVYHRKPICGEGKEAWMKMNAFFHRGVVATYSRLSGLGEDEAKNDLQIRFALVRELKDEDKEIVDYIVDFFRNLFKIDGDGKVFQVESIAGMDNPRLSKLIDDCQKFLIQNFGEVADEMLINNINKTKIIKK